MATTRLTRILGALGGVAWLACDAPPSPDDGEAAVRSRAVVPVVEPTMPRAADPAVAAASDAIAEAMNELDPFERARRLAALLPTLGPEGVPGARDALLSQEFQPMRGGAETELLSRYWATHDPVEATRWAVEESPRGYKISAVFSTLSQWAAQDPAAVL